MKNIPLKSFLMSLLLIGSCAQMMVASEQNKEEYGTRVKATWGQLAKHVGLGLGKILTMSLIFKSVKTIKDDFNSNLHCTGIQVESTKKTAEAVYKTVHQKLAAVEAKLIEENNIDIKEHPFYLVLRPDEYPEFVYNNRLDHELDLLDYKCSVLKRINIKKLQDSLSCLSSHVCVIKVLAGIVSLTGLKDLYNAFKIAKAMRNKETSVKLV